MSTNYGCSAGPLETARTGSKTAPGPELAVQAANTTTLVDDLERHFSGFLAADPGVPLVLAFFSLATHVYDCFDAFPYLGITSPTKRCGKTRTAEVLELFCARPLRTVGMTPAVLFRSIERDKPTLIVDEAEGLRDKGERSTELLAILNAGYRKGQTVRRCVFRGKEWELPDFETYCPKVLVAINHLPDTLADRTISIRMRRRYAGERVDRFIVAQARRDTAPVRDMCEKWASLQQENAAAVYESFDLDDLAFLADRETELWLPLFVVCHLAAPHRHDDLVAAACQLARSRADDEPEDSGIRLLSDVRNVFAKNSSDRISTVDLLKELNAISDQRCPMAGLLSRQAPKCARAWKVVASLWRLAPNHAGRPLSLSA